jgi:signal transduction histidine kinase
MAPPPEALAAGWPAAIALTAALLAARARARRRREDLEAAIHELRRPLQALSLAPPGCSRPGGRACQGRAGVHLSGALSALGDLERAIGEGPPALRLRPLALRALVDAALERCPGAGDSARLSWAAGDARVLADPARLGGALDNLLENALEHGRPPLRVSASICASGVRLVIANGVTAGAGSGAGGRGRGHGLGIVSTTVRAHGGRFLFDRGDRAATAMLELPLAPPSFPEAAGTSGGIRSAPDARAA